MDPDVDQLANRRDAADLGRTRQRLWAAHEVGVRAARYLRATPADSDRLRELLLGSLDKWIPYQATTLPEPADERQALGLSDLVAAETLCEVLARSRPLLDAASQRRRPIQEAVTQWQRQVCAPLRGYAFWELFGRSRLGANVFYCRPGYQAVAILEALGEYEAISAGMFSDYRLSVAFADGGLLLSEPLYLGLSGTRIVGFGALRYFLRAADLSDPPRFRSEARSGLRDNGPEPWRLPQESQAAVDRAWTMMAANGDELRRIASAIHSAKTHGNLT